MTYRGLNVALIIPCYNEESTISKVIHNFLLEMPGLDVFVFNNNSNDRTADIVKNEHAHLIHVSLPGKGNVVRRMFADVDADIYVMVDGDATYDSAAVSLLVDKLIDESLDMVVGCRKTDESMSNHAYRHGHQWGNMMLTKTVMMIFGGKFTDMLSGYRAFTRRYVKSIPVLSHGFEIETELTVHALELRMPYGEVMTSYGARPEGSESKLSTFKDGFKILKTIARLYMTERPLAFFGLLGTLIAITAIFLSIPLATEYIRMGLVPRLPTAILSASMIICALLSFSCGLVLDTITRGRHEMKRLVYLSIPLPKPTRI